MVIQKSTEINPFMEEINVSETVRCAITFWPLWAEKPVEDNQMRFKFSNDIKKRIMELVHSGLRNEGKNMSCCQIQEQLCKDYSESFDIPSVSDINSFVTSTAIAFRDGRNRDSDGQPSKYTRTLMPNDYAEAIENDVQEEDYVTGATIYSKVLEKCGFEEGRKPANFPARKQVISKMYSIRSKRRKGSTAGSSKE